MTTSGVLSFSFDDHVLESGYVVCIAIVHNVEMSAAVVKLSGEDVAVILLFKDVGLAGLFV